MSVLRDVCSSILIGIAAGARTTAAPALLQHALRSRPAAHRDPLVRLATHDRTRAAVRLGTVIEALVDKLPGIGDRTAALGLAARATSGAMSSATLAAAAGRSKWLGAALGGASAFAGTFAWFHLRRALRRGAGVPDVLVGLGEDAIVFGLGRLAVR